MGCGTPRGTHRKGQFPRVQTAPFEIHSSPTERSTSRGDGVLPHIPHLWPGSHQGDPAPHVQFRVPEEGRPLRVAVR